MALIFLFIFISMSLDNSTYLLGVGAKVSVLKKKYVAAVHVYCMVSILYRWIPVLLPKWILNEGV